MASVIPVCEGTLSAGAAGEIVCSGPWSFLESAVFPAPFDPSQLDPGVLAAMFSSGFALILFFWSLGRGISAVLSFIKR
jgi:hypothetical protein